MRKISALIVLALWGCGPAPDWQKPFAKNPAAWGPEETAQARKDITGTACALYLRGTWADAAHPLTSKTLTREDIAALEKVMRGSGISSRDMEVIRLRNQSYGIGQSFLGLSCSLAMALPVNDAFYQGVGHQWQVPLIDGGFVYLEGDGTPTGMKVTGWN